MYCPNCGNETKKNDNFCDKCGNNLNNSNININQKIDNQNKPINISLILGIIACCLFFIPFFSIPLAIVAIILGIINRKEQKITGVILGVISIVLVAIEIIIILLSINFITDKITPYLENTFEGLKEEKLEISGNKFKANDNSTVEFFEDGSYYWSLKDINNYNKGTYTVYKGITAYNYAKNNLSGFKFHEYDLDEFYLIIMMPQEIMVNGSIVNETNTVYYYGEYESDERMLELYNHNTGNKLTLTLTKSYDNIDI